MSTLGRALRERRVVLGLSQEALAEVAGVSARSINRWEQAGAVPQPATRRRLAEVLGLDPADLTPTQLRPASDDPPTAPLAWHVPLRRIRSLPAVRLCLSSFMRHSRQLVRRRRSRR